MSEILLNDPGTLTSSLPNVPLFPIGSEKQNASFELGVATVIHLWPTLQTAVDNQWGGANSEEKREWIAGVIIEEFSQRDVIDIIYIHELLQGILEDEFDTILEDGSTVSVAEKIVTVYNDCRVAQFDKIQAMYQKWLQRNKAKNIVHVDSEDEQSGDEDGDEDMDVDMDDTPAPAPKQKQAPVVDDDGFTVVTKRR